MYTFLILVALLKAAAFDIPRTTPKNFTELVSAMGYESESHQITSQDGYLLTLFNIPGDKTRPVFVLHGAMESADCFVIRGNRSLGYALAKAGYDVWFGNYRGNKYSQGHVTYDPIEAGFWDFTFHEMGYYDLPASIDYILHKTGQRQLSAIGYSLGTTIFFVLGSTRPEYNDKIKIFIALAPVAYLKNIEPPVSTLMQMELLLIHMTQRPTLMTEIVKNSLLSVCRLPLAYAACKQLMFAFTGADDEEFEMEFHHILRAGFPQMTPRKLAQHLIQLKDTFGQYDYGSSRNTEVYNATEPPDYKLSECTMRTALFVGRNDKLSVARDVGLLRDRLPNVVEYRVLDRESFNHVDFVWGRNMHVYLFPFIFDILKKYS